MPKTSSEFWQVLTVPKRSAWLSWAQASCPRRAACFVDQSASHKSAMAVIRPGGHATRSHKGSFVKPDPVGQFFPIPPWVIPNLQGVRGKA
jgi:hypothetical protein